MDLDVNQRTPGRSLQGLLVPALLLAVVVCGVALVVVGAELIHQDLRMQAACHDCPGILSFELAFSAVSARSMLDRWGAEGVEAAQESLRLGAWFTCCYVGLIVALTLLPARLDTGGGAVRQAPWLGAGLWIRTGPRVATAAVLAGLLDLVESHALGRVLATRAAGGDRLPVVAGLAASVKLALVIPAAVIALLAAVAVVLLLRADGVRPRLGR
jgi:hypothetical protein